MTAMRIMAVIAALAMLSIPICASDLDARIESSAKNMYVFKTYLQGDDVTIQSKDGAVTLTGTVSNEPRSMLAQEAIGSLPGVKDVSNKLEIIGQRSQEKSDAWLATNIKTVLLMHRRMSGIEIDVYVKDAVVTLQGEALSQSQKQLITAFAKDIDGVKAVNNEMTVAKIQVRDRETIDDKIDDASISSQIKVSMRFHRSTQDIQAQVKTNDGFVTLSGQAKSAEEKAHVSKLINDINGVVNVENRMTIAKPKSKK